MTDAKRLTPPEVAAEVVELLTMMDQGLPLSGHVRSRKAEELADICVVALGMLYAAHTNLCEINGIPVDVAIQELARQVAKHR